MAALRKHHVEHSAPLCAANSNTHPRHVHLPSKIHMQPMTQTSPLASVAQDLAAFGAVVLFVGSLTLFLVGVM